MSSTSPIREVGARVGIENPYYFSRIFKQKTGLTPGGFRAKHQKPITDGNE
jgi:YesN/AraC family two-component response regulator